MMQLTLAQNFRKNYFDVLIRFHHNPIATVCDIQEMYLQIEFETKDRPFFQILWRDGETDRDPEVYEFAELC